MHAIIADWNEKGIQTRTGKYWRQATLRSIMLNRAMLGETVAGVIGWEPIIDAETFERLTALITPPSMKVRHSPVSREASTQWEVASPWVPSAASP